MLSTEEIHEIEKAISLVPVRKAAGIEALKIVQEHRRWVSDESLREVAAYMKMSAGRTGFSRHILQYDFPKAGRQARDSGLR